MKYRLNLLLFSCALLPVSLPTAYAQTTRDSIFNEVAYGRQAAWKTNAALSTVTSDRLIQVPSATVGNALHGLLPGLTALQQSGEPGNDFSIQNLYARGRSSFVSGQQPLVMIDGFEATLDFISVEEIESISLLKDAAALALYGGRGANGVLLVTTKKGRMSASEIGIRLQGGIQMPTFKNDPVDAYDYARLYNQALANDGLAPRYNSDQLKAYKDGGNPYLYPNVNWRNEILKKAAPLTMAEMSFRGGGDMIRYYVMAGVLQNIGLYRGTDNKRKENSNAYYMRFNFRTNLDVNISKRLTASLYAGGAVGDRSAPGGGNTAHQLINAIWATTPNAFPVYNPDGTLGGNASFTNPVGELLNRGLYKENSRALQVVFNLKYDFDEQVKGLCMTAGVGYNNYEADTSSKTRNYARYSIMVAESGQGTPSSYTYTQYGADEPLTATEGFKTDYSRINFKLQADYSRTFGNHGIDATLFFLSDLYKVYGTSGDIKYLNYAGRLTYNYKKTYVAEIAASYMGNDNFAPGKRYDLFPSVSLGWILSNERFMQKVSWVDYLKLRASAGIIGNDQTTGRHLHDATYGGRNSYLFGTTSAATPGFGEVTLANKEAGWEHKRMLDIGLDATLFHNLQIGFDYFTEVQKDILTEPKSSVPGFVGASYGGILPLMNIGKVENHGFEFTTRYDGEIGKKVGFFVEGGAWLARNKVKEMGENLQAYDYLYGKGNAVGRPIVLVADGYYQPKDFDADGHLKEGNAIPQFGKVTPGDIRYVDQNHDNVIDANDSRPTGHSQVPEWNYTFRLGLKYKGFDMEAFFHGVGNRDVYLNGSSVYSFRNNGTASVLARDSWSAENLNASYPRLSTVDFDNNYRISTFWKRNGNYLRLRNLRIGYTLPKAALKAIQLSNVYVYLDAANLFTIAHLDGLGDPEAGDLTNYPLTKSYNLGVKVAF